MDCTNIFKEAIIASRKLAVLDTGTINNILLKVAEATISNSGFIIEENKKDLALMDKSDPRYDRLLLNTVRLEGIAADIRNVASLPSPLNRVLSREVRPNGLEISRISVPFGVIGVIYEARPNVTFDVFSLCLKSGNACILKGGSDAINSNRAIVDIIRSVLEENGLDKNIINSSSCRP